SPKSTCAHCCAAHSLAEAIMVLSGFTQATRIIAQVEGTKVLGKDQAFRRIRLKPRFQVVNPGGNL
ncbi:MAG TPA: hypothetical protein VJ793_17900, partial [Anaerolineae bacterium]|nr:hypothetical protein [Anaerolineae bacterium]